MTITVSELSICTMANAAAELLLHRWARLTDNKFSLSCHPVVVFFDEETGVVSEVAFLTSMPGIEIGVSFLWGQLHAVLVDFNCKKTFTLALNTQGRERLK
ncbi:hypothetical protein KKF11_02505 [Patescibacteria group bacterium]|nr:hypothetical protein [Patescibacteria group bacterium]